MNVKFRNISFCSNFSLTQKVYMGSCTLRWHANFSFVIKTPHEVSSFTSLNCTCPTAERITTNSHFPTRFCAHTQCLYISWWTWQMDWLWWNDTLAHAPPPPVNPLKPELNPICYLLALLGTHHFLHVSRIRVKLLAFRLLMSYIYGAPILDVSRSHTTTQHSR